MQDEERADDDESSDEVWLDEFHAVWPLRAGSVSWAARAVWPPPWHHQGACGRPDTGQLSRLLSHTLRGADYLPRVDKSGQEWTPFGLANPPFLCDGCTVKTLTSFDFVRRFPQHSKAVCLVKKRGKILGTWQPAPKALEPADFLSRQKEDGFHEPLPFTFAQLLKEGKKR